LSIGVDSPIGGFVLELITRRHIVCGVSRALCMFPLGFRVIPTAGTVCHGRCVTGTRFRCVAKSLDFQPVCRARVSTPPEATARPAPRFALAKRAKRRASVDDIPTPAPTPRAPDTGKRTTHEHNLTSFAGARKQKSQKGREKAAARYPCPHTLYAHASCLLFVRSTPLYGSYVRAL